MPIPMTRSPDTFDLLPNLGGGGAPVAGGAPSDSVLERSVLEIMRSADLNSVTKREIRRQLEEQFDMDLTSRKATINAAIDRILLCQP
jgi:chitin synthase